MNNQNLCDEKLVISKAYDTVELSYKRNSPTFFGFLNEREAELIKHKVHLTDDCVFYGGYSNAQRVVFGCNVSCIDDFPISCIKISYKKEYKLSHRDFLGSLMSLGIDRSAIGDILVYEGYAIVFVKNELSNYVLDNTHKIGNVGVDLSIVDDDDFDYEPNYELISTTVSSLRIDVLVSALCNLSRDKSQSLIKSELVTQNHFVQTSVSKNVSVDDVLAIRKFGKFVLTAINGYSKKGKVKITVKHFR